ncbi:ATP-binding protein [Actinomycetota bacterium Odt1-20B]
MAVELAVAACRAATRSTSPPSTTWSATSKLQRRLVTKLTSYLRPSVLVVDEVGYQPLGARRGASGLPGDLQTLREGVDHPDLEQELR